MSRTYDRVGLFRELRREFALDWHGIHGAAHWGRVCHHGLTVGKIVGANLFVVELFAFLHDSRRVHDGRDRAHGQRAADYAASINGQYFDLTGQECDQLTYAISNHSNGQMHRDVTIQTCWDADRLDLGRVGVIPSPQHISLVASGFVDFAMRWSDY